MPDDGVSDDHSITFRLAERSEAVSGGDLEDRRRRRGRFCRPRPGSRLPLLLHPGSVVSRCRSEGHLGRSRPGCTGPVQRNTRSRGGGSVSSALYTYPGLVSVSPGCSSPALKGRHKSTIKASNSETMVMCVNRVLAVLASVATAVIAVLTVYKLIADSGNQNKTSDNKVL